MPDSKDQMEEAIARAKKEVADEVQEHKVEDKDLEDVAGGDQELWTIGVIYTT